MKLATSAPIHFILTSFSLFCVTEAQRVISVTSDPPSPACGTRFVDPASSALRADAVIQGRVQGVEAASLLTPLLLTARVSVEMVLKGEAALHAPGQSESPQLLHVQGLGPREIRESCVGTVTPGRSYLFFLTAQNASDAQHGGVGSRLTSSGAEVTSGRAVERGGAVLENCALPVEMDASVLSKVKRILCPDCSSVPIIRRVRCKHCASKPAMKRPLSRNSTKTVQSGRRLSLRCVARGSPLPSYTWVRDGDVLYSPEPEPEGSGGSGRPRSKMYRQGKMAVRSGKHYSLLMIQSVTSEDQGTYLCLASNAMGDAQQTVRVLVEGGAPRPSPSLPTLEQRSQGSEAEGQTDIDPCAVNPCYNGGMCVRDATRADCQCPSHYHGNRCQFKRRVVEPEEPEEENEPSVDVFPAASTESNTEERDNNHNNTETIITNSTVIDPVTTKSQSPPRTFSAPSNSQTFISKKKRRKYASTSRGRYGATGSSSGKPTKSGAPKLKVSECPEADYCMNGGTCTIVVKIKRQFCKCAPGFAGRRCERSV